MEKIILQVIADMFYNRYEWIIFVGLPTKKLAVLYKNKTHPYVLINISSKKSIYVAAYLNKQLVWSRALINFNSKIEWLTLGKKYRNGITYPKLDE